MFLEPKMSFDTDLIILEPIKDRIEPFFTSFVFYVLSTENYYSVFQETS